MTKMVLEFLLGLVYAFEYLGGFLGLPKGSATILLPIPSPLIVFVAGKIFDPFLVEIIEELEQPQANWLPIMK
jgi:hypothetical protein